MGYKQQSLKATLMLLGFKHNFRLAKFILTKQFIIIPLR